MDSVPLLAITGQVPTTSLGSDSFQEADIYGISIPITKYNYLVKDPALLPGILREAYYLAGTGRPGPVLVDVPKDVQTALIESEAGPSDLPEKNGRRPLSDAGVKDLIEAIAYSIRPVIYLGGGAAGSAKEILALAEGQDMAVVSTLQAKGCFPDNHPLSLGLPGMHGSKYANLAINESDLILGLGVRFDDRVVGNVRRFAPFAKVAHVDIDPAEIGKRLPADVAVIGDLREVLSAALAKMKKRSRPQWRERVAELRRLYPLDCGGNCDFIKPQAAIRALSDLCRGEAVVVTDVGQHQMWAAQHFQCQAPRRFLSSGGLGTMGYGLPAAMGAALAKPERPVVLIAGDGGFQMNVQELATIRENSLPVKIMLVNNGCLGMVRQWQQFFFEKRYSQTVFGFSLDFTALAKVYGLEAWRIDSPKEVKAGVERLMAAKGPALLEVIIPLEENVLPMIPAGQGQTDFFEADEEGGQ
jgi:acetolactate synthase-1/2/3 large subunit